MGGDGWGVVSAPLYKSRDHCFSISIAMLIAMVIPKSPRLSGVDAQQTGCVNDHDVLAKHIKFLNCL